MNPILLMIISTSLAGVVGIVGFTARTAIQRLHDMEKAFNQHLVDDARIATSIQELKPQLDKLEEKIDEIIYREIGSN